MPKKLQNKTQLKPKTKQIEKPLTFEQKFEQLEKEKQVWKDCWNAMLDKFNEFFPSQDIEDILDETPPKDPRHVIYQYLYEVSDKVHADFKKRKNDILDQMTPTQRWEWDWNELQQEKAEWKKERAETLKKIEEHYKTHKGGGMFYRWFDDDCYHMEQYLAEKELKLRERGRQLDKLKQLDAEREKRRQEEEFAKAKTKKPHLVKASLKPVEEQEPKTKKSQQENNQEK